MTLVSRRSRFIWVDGQRSDVIPYLEPIDAKAKTLPTDGDRTTRHRDVLSDTVESPHVRRISAAAQVVETDTRDHALSGPSTPFEASRLKRPLLICVPLFRRADLAQHVVDALVACADELRELEAEVVLYQDSPGDAELDAALDLLAPRAERDIRIRVERNPVNLGFVRTCNQAMLEARDRGMDVLLLNSDTVVSPGALREMARVSRLDPMIGFVNPRSNNATLATLPYQDSFRHLPPAQARAAWSAIHGFLPEMSFTPTAHGFCILIRWLMLVEFGFFDEIYGRGYNEENDLVMRAGRRGYRSVLANHAFVWHEGSSSFGLDPTYETLETRNRAVLLRRYPEYAGLTDSYFMSAEQRAEFLLGAMIPDEQGRVDVALDFSSFVPAQNGTFLNGVQLAAGVATQWRDRFNLHVLCNSDVYDYHELSRYGLTRRDPHGPEAYAAIIRVGQPYDWGALQRLSLKGAAVGIFMLDTISIDCSQLTSSRLKKLWSYAFDHSDFIVSISAFTKAQYMRRFDIKPDTPFASVLLSLDLADYTLPSNVNGIELPESYVLVVGNHYWHKDVANAVNALTADDAARPIVVLGYPREFSVSDDGGRYAPRGIQPSPNVTRIEAGRLSFGQMGALFDAAEVVVVPSHYEGFGMTLMNALAMKTPVFVRALPVVDEIRRAIGGDENVHLFHTTADMVARLRTPPAWSASGASPGRPGDVRRLADEVGVLLDEALSKVDYRRIVRRIDALRSDEGEYETGASSAQLNVSRHVGRLAEHAFLDFLRLPGVTPASRLLMRAWRRISRPSTR